MTSDEGRSLTNITWKWNEVDDMFIGYWSCKTRLLYKVLHRGHVPLPCDVLVSVYLKPHF